MQTSVDAVDLKGRPDSGVGIEDSQRESTAVTRSADPGPPARSVRDHRVMQHRCDAAARSAMPDPARRAGNLSRMTDTPASPFRTATTIDRLNALSRDTAIVALGIEFTEIGPDFLRATMPVDARTKQPYGLLHGGASVLLAETLGSTAGNMCVPEDRICVGIEINANHVRGAREGVVTGTARALHVGAGTHVWEIRIEDARGRLVCISRLTLAVVAREAR